MLQFDKILKVNKALLLVSTSILVASCGTSGNEGHNSTAKINTATSSETEAEYSGEFTPNRMMRIAERAWNKGNTETALRFYSMASNKAPDDPAPVLAIADILRKTKRTAAALELYQKLAAKFPNSAESHAGIGYTLLAEDKPYLAVKSFEQAVGLDQENAKSLGGLGLALDTAGEHDKAQDYYRLAIKIEPVNLTYQNNLALSLALVGRTEQAIAMFEVITAHPHATARHRQNLALVYGMAGKSAEALRYSRMDLNESDARNNALYFQALNGDATETPLVKNAAIATSNNSTRDPATSRQPYTVIEAKHDTVAISTEPNIPVAEPSQLLASARLTNQERSLTTARQPHTLVAARENTITLSTNPAPVSSVATTKPFQELTKIAKAIGASQSPAYKAAMQYTAEPLEVAAMMTKTPVLAAKAEVISPATATAKLPETLAQIDDISSDLPLEITSAPKPTLFSNSETSIHTIAYKKNVTEYLPEPMMPEIENFVFNADHPLYYVQVASFQSLQKAEMAWDELTAQHSDILVNYNPVYTVADVESKGTYYRVRIGGFAAKSIPEELCNALKTRDADCYLTRVESQIEVNDAVIATSDPVNDIEDSQPTIEQVNEPEKKQWKIDGQTTAFISY